MKQQDETNKLNDTRVSGVDVLEAEEMAQGATFVQAEPPSEEDAIATDIVDVPLPSFTTPKPANKNKKSSGKSAAVAGNFTDPNVVHTFALDELIVDQTHNGRFKLLSPNDADIKELAKSIKANGQLVPGLVTLRLDGYKELTAGNRRFIALSILNTDKPKSEQLKFRATVKVEHADNTVQATLDNATENFHRKDLTALDKCKIVNDLMSPPFNLTTGEVHERLAISKPLIHLYKRTWAAPEKVKQHVAADRIPLKGVYEIMTVDAENVQAHVEKLVARAGERNVTVDMCSEYVRSLRDAASDKGKKSKKASAKVKRLKQRTSAQIVKFLDGVSKETLAEYEDKALPGKLKIVRAYVAGGAEEAFLKGLATL